MILTVLGWMAVVVLLMGVVGAVGLTVLLVVRSDQDRARGLDRLEPQPEGRPWHLHRPVPQQRGPQPSPAPSSTSDMQLRSFIPGRSSAAENEQRAVPVS